MLSKRHILLAVALLILSLSPLIFAFLWVKLPSFKMPSLPFLNQKPFPETSQLMLDTCQVKKEGNPLVEAVKEENSQITGIFKGKVINIAEDQARGSRILELKSIQGNQSYKFNVLSEKGEANLAKISLGHTVILNFTCTNGNLFKYTEVLFW